MKNKIITYIFVIYIFSFSVLGIVLKDKEISSSERRRLATFPTLTLNNELSEKIEKYLLDHFPFRDNFRSIKSYYNYKVLQKLDNNGIYLKDNYIFKSNYPTNKDSIEYLNNNLNSIKEMFSEDNKVYLMVIPDKNYYLEETNFLHIDYDYIYNSFYNKETNYIDLRKILELNDYYETDTHWKQENLNKVVKKMSEIMNFDYVEYHYKENIYNKFYGVYYGEAAINRKPEKLTYLTHNYMDNIVVKYLENKNLNDIYNEKKLNGLDAYEAFLDGASSFIEINNNDSLTKKELVVFRDSFGSSLVPLLIQYYKKITVIDNRYISSKNFKELIEFNNQDILFMYSTLIANNSYSLKG